MSKRCNVRLFSYSRSHIYLLFTEKIIEEAINSALKEADRKGIFGKEVTPFILAAVAKATSGASLNASILFRKNKEQYDFLVE